MLLTGCEIILMLTRSANFVICEADRAIILAMTDWKIYVPVVTLSTEENIKLLKQLKSGFKRIINGANIS